MIPDDKILAAERMEVHLAAVGSKATFAGAGTTIGGWLLSSEGAVFVGIVLGVLGLLVNVWFSRRRDAREQRQLELRQAEHEARMKRLAEHDTQT